MASIIIEQATPDRFDDAQHALSGGGDGRGCQCQWWMMPNSRWQQTSQQERQTMLRDELAAGPPPALIAYVDGEAVGWVRIGPRTRQVRIGRTRHFATHSEEPWDDETVWSVSCFVVRKEFRKQGLNARLLAAAIDYARARGARVIEAYPLDPDAGRKIASNELFHGVVATFAQAGFREVARPKPHLAIVSLDLAH
ncbi:GNAT family N-acetyltransferase [Microbacterium sp. M3]|uniref:GNAT family N-acetyltransferase n=1 Tax=Microbacterium arthrosphaerae TaxID=792652 RepID=A0ABU4GYQ1_9MICO|nr:MULTISPECIES: GNAT family N-acetyltransferase [Microbacterium]MDW4572207.1 GNAT family N-acetyltransferase [Microbacterium arthrosphaerae]MDW7606062.1 GNAT family N-acetyltransferase [Microbacterium sp. M3]